MNLWCNSELGNFDHTRSSGRASSSNEGKPKSQDFLQQRGLIQAKDAGTLSPVIVRWRDLESGKIYEEKFAGLHLRTGFQQQPRPISFWVTRNSKEFVDLE
jgi:hypothetical protein